jgi:trimethylamine monooxygenase
VVLCFRTESKGTSWPESLTEKSLVTRFEGNVAHFGDGTSKPVDCVILCTGYLHRFPFLEKNLTIETDNRLWVEGLYKTTVYIKNAKLMYIGMQNQWFSFVLFDLQAWYVRDVIVGKIVLPPLREMEANEMEWRSRAANLSSPRNSREFQGAYMSELNEMTDYYRLDMESRLGHLMQWEKAKKTDITSFRDQSFPSTITGTMGEVPNVPWM